jgi:hypothetical protein
MSELVEQVARALYEAHHNAGPFADEPIEWGRGGYKTQVAIWHAVARAALSVLEPRIEQLERELAEGWQDIATAPKDGTRVIVYSTTDTPHYADQDYVATVLQGEHVEEVQVARWCEDFEEWELQFIGAPLFWCPLPPPPTGERG